jgi:hypothetical protein
MNKMNKERFKRILAFYLALNIIFEVVSPSVAFALTSGPGQPEMASFEPVGTTEMVDVFSGDFNYNIPLLTVPGPNGGYPINMAYHSGIGMDDEASWVGLGWNINPGVISRQLRGIPDDFSGEKINKKLNMNPNRTVNLGFGIPFSEVPEIWGFKFNQSLKLGMVWNNYMGIGFSGGYSLSQKESKNGANFGLSLNYNSLAGETSLNPSLSLDAQKGANEYKFGLSASISSLSGLKDLNFSSSRTKLTVAELGPVLLFGRGGSVSASTSFASQSFVPHSEFPQSGWNVSANVNLGTDAVGIFSGLQIDAGYTQSKYSENDIDFLAYGYLNSQSRSISSGTDNNYKLMDFNREKDAMLSKDIPAMPVPVSTYDIYMVKGQGIGGTFRPYRTDIGLLVDPSVKGETVGGAIGGEIGGGVPTMNFGMNLSVNYSKSYSGTWNKSDLWKDLRNRTHKGRTYFKNASEIVANEVDENFDMASLPFPITTMVSVPDFSDMSLDPTEMAEMTSPIVDIRVNNTGGIIGSRDHYDTKRTVSQLMTYKTFDEISHIPNYHDAWVKKSVYDYNVNPLTSGNVAYSSSSGAQIGEMSVINEDGNRYIYALPAKNSTQKEVSFSIKKDNGTRNSPDEKIINFTDEDNSLDNVQLDDHFFSSTEIPSYVHSYMLTAIVSPDYVDLKDDGLTDDDFGYWVKFNYTKTSSNYKWRAPFLGANYMKGYLSDDNDDKAGYTYGEKEIWYLNSIETKSHIALFTLGQRADAKGAAMENQILSITGGQHNFQTTYMGGDEQKKLDKITLYSKTSPNTPLKEVHFDYDYDLCKNTWNTIGTNPDKGTSTGHGKLTLNKVWFTYMGNEKGALSPYVFDYHQTPTATNGVIPEENPEYSNSNVDRWGNYSKHQDNYDNTIFPYTPQSSAINPSIRNAYASAWTLKEITLPSGGKIKVNYEADDYKYVHDKPAMEMVKVLGFGETPSSTISDEMKSKNVYLFFEMNDPSDNVQEYVEGIDDMYFNIFIDLKKDGIQGVNQKDYVDGYAKISQDPATFGTLGGGIGYLKVEKVSVKDNPQNSQPETHPFRKAAWQYLKLERKDILFPASNNNNSSGSVGVTYLKQVANSLIGAFQSATQLFTGFYNYCNAAGYGKKMASENPSFIRLSSPGGRKYGGGHRVKQIVLTDTWTETKTDTNNKIENESKYGQEYSYNLPDGTSSGVASYEPLIGGEEIPYRKPIRYSSPYFIFKNRNLYMEEPVGESYYPGASVGYSRVVVKNIKQTETPTSNVEVTKTREGITVHEFYTTKDFPYEITRGGLLHEKFNPKIPVPFIGSVGFENHGFSQQMNVVTNDMHGKARSVSTFAAGADINNPSTLPVSKIEYIYNTDGQYDPNGTNRLYNKVDALFGDAFYRQTDMGVTSEQYLDVRETFGVSMNQGMQTNLDWTLPYIFVPSFMPIIDYSENLYKSVVAMRVKSMSGILMETRSFNEGSTVTSKNLMFDAYTGKPLLKTVTNDFDKPIYSYDFQAQWAYGGMGNAYKNDRAKSEFSVLNGVLTFVSPYDVFEGDELLIKLSSVNSYSKAWITETVPSIIIRDDQGNFISDGNYTGLVLRSGRRNQQSVSNGNIVSLTNPLNGRSGDLFWDKVPSPYINQGNAYLGFASVFNCRIGTNELYSLCWMRYINSNRVGLVITQPGSTTHPQGALFCLFAGGNVNTCSMDGTCFVYITFEYPSGLTQYPGPTHLRIAGNKAYIIEIATGNVILIGDVINNCSFTTNSNSCLDGVLNASAYEFKDNNWNYNYEDVGDPLIKYMSNNSTHNISTEANNLNPYRLGNKGIWRMERSYAFQTSRKQSPNSGANINKTKINEDGTFEKFTLFNWGTNDPDANNPDWTKVNQVTKYNPYGFEIENKNAIDVYTSALYGYNNSLQTAIVNNAQYYQMGYESFEDQGTTYTKNSGHINLTPLNGNLSSNAHTGKKALEIAGSQAYNMVIPQNYSPTYYYFQPHTNVENRYIVSAWFKVPPGASPNINITGATGIVHKDNLVIEGWQKVELEFYTSNASNTTLSFSVANSSGNSYIDDIRIQPFKSTMKTFVYDPATLWLKAELDNQNYATFYNYDEEGTLTQVKKETVKGIQTLKTTRSNIKRK